MRYSEFLQLRVPLFCCLLQLLKILRDTINDPAWIVKWLGWITRKVECMLINRAMNIVVTDYDERWVALFEHEAAILRNILKDDLVDIHHIGSTAVPHLKAKPIIDIMPVVKDIARVDAYNEELINVGYEPLHEFGIRGRRYFRKGEVNRTHQMHVFQFDNRHQIERHLAVRDYLRTHQEDRIAYGELKQELAVLYPMDIEGYCDGKDEFVVQLERRALEWKNTLTN